MVMMAERTPRIVAASRGDRPAGHVIIICTGLRRGGKTCNCILGSLDITHPHNVRYDCRNCGSFYVLQKPIT